MHPRFNIYDSRYFNAKNNLLNLNAQGIDDQNIVNVVVPYLSAHRHITGLDLSFNPIGVRGILALTSLNITTLYVCNTALGDEGAWALTQLRALEELYVSHANLGEEGARALAMIPNLRVLGAENNHFRDAGLAILSRHEHLERIFLMMNGISNKGAEDLSKLLSLHFIDMSYNPVQNSSVVALCRLPHLKGLDMMGNEITYDAAKYMAATLREYRIPSNLLTEEEMASLQVSSPLAKANLKPEGKVAPALFRLSLFAVQESIRQKSISLVLAESMLPAELYRLVVKL